MTEADLQELNRGRVLRLFTERGGAQIGQLALAGFQIDGDSAQTGVTNAASNDLATSARWGELVDDAGVVVAAGPLAERSAEVDSLLDQFWRGLVGQRADGSR